MAVAIYGGTFDPVHLGHKQMVETALEEFSLSELVIVPNANPPHKKDMHITDFSHRYNMLVSAFDGLDKVTISDYEKDRGVYSYSVDTMRHFRSVYGDDTYFIIGADSLLTIHTWYDSKTLLKENQFIVFRRNGDTTLLEEVDRYKKEGYRIYLSSMPKIDISSTDVRNALFSGQSTDKLLCPKVCEYIKAHSLYGGLI